MSASIATAERGFIYNICNLVSTVIPVKCCCELFLHRDLPRPFLNSRKKNRDAFLCCSVADRRSKAIKSSVYVF